MQLQQLFRFSELVFKLLIFVRHVIHSFFHHDLGGALLRRRKLEMRCLVEKLSLFRIEDQGLSHPCVLHRIEHSQRLLILIARVVLALP